MGAILITPYRILVVDDSAFMRKIISDLIVQDEQFSIVGTATNGIEAASAAAELKPDAITMDLEMPHMNGIEALQLIMRRNPVPVIMLSGISEANTRDTIKALQFGAFDFIRKPTSPVTDDIRQVGEILLDKLRVAVLLRRGREASASAAVLQPKPDKPLKQDKPPSHSERGKSPVLPPIPQKPPIVKPVSAAKEPPSQVKKTERAEPTARLAPAPPKREKGILNTLAAEAAAKRVQQPTDSHAEPPNKARRDKAAPAAIRHIVAIGTSTGGPRALHEVITSLPGDFPAPVLVVQHMPPKFTKSLAQRLDTFSPLTVVEAEQGMKVTAGTVYIAPGGRHMELAKSGGEYEIVLTEQPQRNGHRPSVDVMYESLLDHRELKRHIVLMTGMGSDGAKGMKLLADSGAASTIAESEETCVVYGMPRSAIEGGFVQSVLPLQLIAPQLVQAVLASKD